MKRILKMILFIILSAIGIILIAGILFINLSPQFGAKSQGESAERLRASPNYKNGKFQNIETTLVMKKANYSTIPDYFTNDGKSPEWSIPVEKVSSGYFADQPDSLTRLTWFGHSAVLLEIAGKKIFLDPMLGDVPAPHPWLGAARFNDTLPLPVDQLPHLDAVLISHDHYDHLDYGSIIALKDRVDMFYVPLGVGGHLAYWGVDKDKITELDWWDEVYLDSVKLVSTPARHFSGRGLFDRYTTLWCSWVVSAKSSNIFFGGDSGYDGSFKAIGEKYGPFDFAMLECGQYNEQWPEIHMMPEETVQASIDLKSEILMPIHWGAFKLALHPWEEPVERAVKRARELNVSVATPKIGEPLILANTIPSSAWWKKR